MAHKGPRAPGPPPAVCPQAIPGGLPGGSCPPHASWCQSTVLPRGPVPSLFSRPPSPGSVRTPLAVKGPASGLTHPTLFRDEGRTGQGLSHGASSHGPAQVSAIRDLSFIFVDTRRLSYVEAGIRPSGPSLSFGFVTLRGRNLLTFTGSHVPCFPPAWEETSSTVKTAGRS